MNELTVAKSFNPHKLPLFAAPLDQFNNTSIASTTDFHPFEWTVPRSFLSQATAEAIENGLVTKI